MSKIFKIVAMMLMIVACSKFDKRDDLAVKDINGEKVAYKVELAQTEKEMAEGLMNREKLDENSGMLFALGNYDVPSAMWMKDTKISLDMLFINDEGMIFWIYENAEPESTKLIVPPYPAYAVLEVNGGDAKKYGIKIGDMIEHQWFKEEMKKENSVVGDETPKDGISSEENVTEEEIKDDSDSKVKDSVKPINLD